MTNELEDPNRERMMSPAGPENGLLVCAARRHLDAAKREQIRRLLREDLDWRYLLALADRHGMIPLLYCHLKSVSAAVPPQIIAQLRDDSYEISRSNLSLTGELIKLLDLLEAHDLQAIPFKGPALALLAYGDVGLRQFTDLDILVRKRDALRVRELLVDRGFKPEPELTRGQEAALLRFDCAYTFVDAKGVVLDVHWDFAPRYFSFDIDPNRLWGRLEPIAIGGKQLLTLSPEDLLLCLCIHGFTHIWERLGWICDIASLIEREHIDWQFVLQNASRMGSQRVLSLGLFLAGELLEVPIPQEVSGKLADAAVAELGRQIQKQLLAPRNAAVGIFAETRIHLKMRERKWDRVRACLRLVATPRSYDWRSLSLPEWLFFLYYLLRPVRLAQKYGARFLKVVPRP
jgi:hypothetical protein